MTKELTIKSKGKAFFFLSECYQPSHVDVICGRGKSSFTHSGNVNFRASIVSNLKGYTATKNKVDKSAIVAVIADKFLCEGGVASKFIRFCDQEKRWYEISYELVRQKVGQYLRDAITQNDARKLFRKKLIRSIRCADRSRKIMGKMSLPTTDMHFIQYPQHHPVLSASPPIPAIKSHTSRQEKDPRGRFPSSTHVSLDVSDILMDVRSHGHDHHCRDSLLGYLTLLTPHGGHGGQPSNKADFCRSDEDDSDVASVTSCDWFGDYSPEFITLPNCDLPDDEFWSMQE